MITVCDTVLVTRNARDKIQVARYILDKDESRYIIKRFTGQFGGKMTSQPEKLISAGKVKRNVFQQAELEYNSLIKKATDKGYKKLSDLTKVKYDSITSEQLDVIVASTKTDSSGQIKPQLAKSSNDCAISIYENELFGSRKLDGVRALLDYHKDTKTAHSHSRGGTNYDEAIPHILTDPILLAFFEKNPDIILDGELYVHGWSLQRISGSARLKTFDEERCGKLEYWIFDIADINTNFNERLDVLIDMSINEFENHPIIKIVEHVYMTGWSQIKRFHDKWVGEGFEGLVLRKNNKKYSPGSRNSDWVKLKEYMEEEFEIVGVSEGLRDEDMCFTLITKKGKTFDAKPIGTRETRQEYLDNSDSYIGKKGTVKFFSYSDEGVPMQPSFRHVREEGE